MPSASSSSSATGGKKLTSTEKKIHHIALHAPANTVLVNEIGEQLDLEASEVMMAANGLLKKNLVSIQQTERGMQLVAVSRMEASMIGSLSGEEAMIYKQIKDSNNEGIWTKALKARTNLHQTVLMRVLKALENRQLVKSVKSVKHPTRKIYMLYNVTPSVELSGGPWYTDNELDTPFINGLASFCHHFIQQQTWPGGFDSSRQKLYPASHTNRLPTALRVLKEIQDKQVTTVKLEVSNVQTLLETLVYDEKIEKVPMLGGVVDAFAQDSAFKSDEDDSEWEKKKRSTGGEKRSKKNSQQHNRNSWAASDDEASGSSSDSLSGSSRSEVEGGSRKRKRSGKHRSSSKSSKRSRSSSSRKSAEAKLRAPTATSSSDEEESNDDSGSDDDRYTSERSTKSTSTRKPSGSDKKKSKSLSTAKYTGPDFQSDEDDDEEGDEGDTVGAGAKHGSAWGVHSWVYRALRPVEVAQGFTETPCARCPVSDFCRPRGPVNSEECVYYGDWMKGRGSDGRTKTEER